MSTLYITLRVLHHLEFSAWFLTMHFLTHPELLAHGCFNNFFNTISLQMLFSHLKYSLSLFSPPTGFYSFLKTQLKWRVLREAISKRRLIYIRNYFGRTITMELTRMCSNYLIRWLTLLYCIFLIGRVVVLCLVILLLLLGHLPFTIFALPICFSVSCMLLGIEWVFYKGLETEPKHEWPIASQDLMGN